MSTLDLQEQEQVDAIRAWWKDNGKWVVGALTIALLGYAGLQFWKNYQANQALEAGKLFNEVVKQTATGDAKRINDATAALIEKFGNSAYAPRAQLLAVQANLQANDASRAKAQLQWIIEHATETALQDTARLKLSAELLDEQKYEEALKVLDAAHPDAFTGLYADLKGDILAAQGKVGEARTAYTAALDKLGNKNSYRVLVQLKLDGLGGTQ